MKKFWKVKNEAAEEAEILIYGEIVPDKWLDNDTTAKEFAEELGNLKGKKITVRINSAGGDVFTGLTISNLIKKAGNVTVAIDGLAASAASVVAMGGAKIQMANNALMMIHLPAVMLFGYYEEPEIDKIKNGLSTVKETIITTYKNRPLKEGVDVEKMMKSETWFTAQEALEAGFIDEIMGEAELAIDNSARKLFVNSIAFDTSRFNAEKFQKVTGGIKMAEVQNQTPEKVDAAAIRQEIRNQELARIKALQRLKCANAAVNAIIDVALEKGVEVSEVQAYIDALKGMPAQKNPQNATQAITDLIKDQMESGAANVGGEKNSSDAETEAKAAQIKNVIDFANKIIGAKQK